MVDGRPRDSYRAEAIEFVTAVVLLTYGISTLLLSPLLERLGVADDRLMRPFCWATGHEWADDDPYGVEPVCLYCSKDRRQA